jgi:hypothetical protein
MGFDDRTLRMDDSPKTRVKAMRPAAKCRALYWSGRRDGYVVEVDDKLIGAGRSAWDAWRQAETTIEAEAQTSD